MLMARRPKKALNDAPNNLTDDAHDRARVQRLGGDERFVLSN
jgi:hypothetical protein